MQVNNLEAREQAGNMVNGLFAAALGGTMAEPQQVMAAIVFDPALLAPTPKAEPVRSAPVRSPDAPALNLRVAIPRATDAPPMTRDWASTAMPFRNVFDPTHAPELDLSITNNSTFDLRPSTPIPTPNEPTGGGAVGHGTTPVDTAARATMSGDAAAPAPVDQSVASAIPVASTLGPVKVRTIVVARPLARAANTVRLELLPPTHPDAGGVGGFRVWRLGTAGNLTIRYAVGGSAVPGVHYERLTGEVTITEGNRSAPIVLQPLRNDVATGKKQVIVALRTGTDYSLTTPRRGKVRLGDFQSTPVVSVQATKVQTTDQGDPRPGEVTFTRSNTRGPLAVRFQVSGSATSSVDYHPLVGTVEFPAGVGQMRVQVLPVGDELPEGLETVLIQIEPSTRYDRGSAEAMVLIGDGGTQAGRGPVAQFSGPGGGGPSGQAITEPLPMLIPCECSCQTPSSNRPSLLGRLMLSGGIGPALVGYTFSQNPVHYAFGQVRLGSVDLESQGFGVAWGQARTWSNRDGYDQRSSLGTGWATEQTPHVIVNSENATASVVFNANIAMSFYQSGGGYLPTHGGPESLEHDTTNKRYIFRDSTGQKLIFFDEDTSYPEKKRWSFASLTDPYGNITEAVSWDGDGRITEVQRARTVSGVTTTESLLTTYVSSGVNAGLQSSVVLRRKVGAGSWGTVRQVEYSYYDGTTANGPAKTLQRAIVKDGASQVLNTDYYRYYTANSSPGYTNGLKYFIGGAQYARLEADQGSAANVNSASDGTIAPYANNYFEYGSDRRVTKEIASGAGCSSCSGGQGEFTYSYTNSNLALSTNTWATKTVVTQPDGNQEIVYTNYLGAIMLKAYKDTTTNDVWPTFYRYDSLGREILRAEPSAVNGWNDSYGDLMNFVYGSSSYLNDATGLISTRTFSTSNTATSSTAGDVIGYFKEAGIQRGEAGTSVKQRSAKYIERTTGGVTTYPTAEETVYRNTNGTGGQTTTHSYTFHSGTHQVAQHTITRPAVTTTQNGSNSTDADVVVYDAEGRPVWVKDAAGYISYFEYDQQTGAVTKVIGDVDTTQTGTFSNLPSGWSTPGGGGLHQTSAFEVDEQGRTTKATDANGNITYTVFDDDAHEVRVYAGWDSTNNVATGPTVVVREDRARGYRETLTMSATPNVSGGRPTGTESIGSIQTLAREVLNEAGQVLYQDAYFNLTGVSYSQSSVTLGTSGTNYHRTTLAYNKTGQHAKTVTATGTIHRDEFDGQGRLQSRWVGTDDVPTTGFWSTTNLTGTDMVKVWEGEYDGGAVGDGLLTKETHFPGGGATNRVIAHSYDWRQRRVATKNGVETSESTSVNRPILYVEYDNLNNAIVQESYDGDTLSITTDSNSDGVPDRPSSSALRAKGTTDFDEQGRAYKSSTFSVNPSNGNVSTDALVSMQWHNSRGLTMKSTSPGGVVSKSQFDGLGRTTKNFVTDGGGDSGYSDADDVSGDAVLSQTEFSYDIGGRTLMVTSKERFHDETTTGELGNASTAPKARVSYATSYYDKANRTTASVNVGTNGGSSYTRPGSVPSRSDTVLVNEYGYNAAGWVETTTDAKGIVGKTYFDLLGRTTKTIENYVDGTPSDTDDKTVEYTYNGTGQMTTLKAHLASGYQTTEWVYGITSPIVSNDVLKEMRYPDASSGNASSSEKDSYTYNQLGDVLTKTDRNGNVHTYTFDVLVRHTSDAVTTLGSGVDGSVRRIETSYNTQGLVHQITSYDAATSGSVVNQIERGYNGLGQMTVEYQAVDGAVNTSTTPKVQYGYSEMASSANHSRLNTITYPNGRVLTYNYANGLDNNISRLSSISDGGTTLESYDYLGFGTVVSRKHTESGVDITYVKLTGESDGAAGDKYNGLDLFGRVIDQRWTAGTTTKDRFAYGYDRNSNRLYKENLMSSSNSELYAYDDLNQLTSFDRGTLNGTKTGLTGAASRSQSWDFDALGNFDSQSTNGTGQSRSHNKQNEITSIAGATTPTYDANGNLTTDETGQTYKYDAWNRTIEVKNSGGTTIATNEYDGTTRRVQEVRNSVTTDLYYSDQWQVFEERIGGVARLSYAWSPVYVDAMIARDRDSDSNGSLDERLYVAQDANFNVTALVNTSGVVVERYQLDAYGTPTVFDGSFGSRGSSSYAFNYLHQGGRWDATVSDYLFRYRGFRPTLGRWTTMDPIGFAGGDVNWFGYVGNNSVHYSDPAGTVRIRRNNRGQIIVTDIREGEAPIKKICEDGFRQAVIVATQLLSSGQITYEMYEHVVNLARDMYEHCLRSRGIVQDGFSRLLDAINSLKFTAQPITFRLPSKRECMEAALVTATGVATGFALAAAYGNPAGPVLGPVATAVIISTLAE